MRTATGEDIEIATCSADHAFFLDEILADTIGSSEVRFSFQGPETPAAAKPFYPAEEILADYGPLLKSLPGVGAMATITLNVGEWLPAFETGIEIVTSTEAQSQLLNEILEPQVAGTKMLVRSKNQRFDQYGRLSESTLGLSHLGA